MHFAAWHSTVASRCVAQCRGTHRARRRRRPGVAWASPPVGRAAWRALAAPPRTARRPPAHGCNKKNDMISFVVLASKTKLKYKFFSQGLQKLV